MMHEFLADNRGELIARCKAKVAERPSRGASALQLQNGVPLFIEQLTRTLDAEKANDGEKSFEISGAPGGRSPASSEIGISARAHGRALLDLGYTVDQVVFDYGDLCQAITELALEQGAPFEVEEFKTLNRCLDNAIADAVTEFSRQREGLAAEGSASDANERLASLLHEMRNALHTGHLAVLAMEQGSLSLAGATGTVLKRSLAAMNSLVMGSMAEVRSARQPSAPQAVFLLAPFIEEARAAAKLEADARGCVLVVAAVDSRLQVEAQRVPLHAALSNLLLNAFKFTHPHSQVHLRAHAADGQVHLHVEDRCGGLAHGDTESLFTAAAPQGTDRSGLGLGLSIARQNVEAMGGTLTAENRPGKGCIFTIRLRMGALGHPAASLREG